ncbi:MAG: GTP-binding protein [Candidatus Lokiarchaeota archaeon]|nr:GTP-binding protein [Candidatus Lokiarchaeota archaeon]
MFKRKDSKPILLKVITCGEGGVGKTTLLHRYIEGVFLADTRLTIGVEFFLKELEIDGKKILLQIWDFGGQERFRFLLENYAVGARGALLLFDLTRISSLQRIKQWISICRQDDIDIPIIFLGTKLDLTDEIVINDEYAFKFKEKYSFFDYLKISSKTGENVNLAFELLARELVKNL